MRKFLLVLIAIACLTAGKASAMNLTLSDEGLMSLDEYSRRNPDLKATILERTDVEGPGVEFEIYFPSNKHPDNSIYYCFSEDKLKEMLEGIDVGSYDAFELKFTMIPADGSDPPDSGGSLVVGAYIGGAYRPETISLGKHRSASAVSTTRINQDRIALVGFTAHTLTSRGWDENGTTVTLLIEPCPGATAIPKAKEKETAKSENSVIYVDSSASGANNGTSWVNGFTHLQDGLGRASGGDEVWVAAGVYKPDEGQNYNKGDRSASFILKKKVAVYGGFPPGGGARNEIDPRVHLTILSGDLLGNDKSELKTSKLLDDATRSDNSYHVVSASGTDSDTVLSGFVITGGNATGERHSSYDRGGGLYCKSADLTVSNCVFKANSANSGGGVYSVKGNPFVVNCTFLLNYANDSGGGMCNSRSSPVLYNCIFGSNSAKEKGGGVYNGQNSPIKINCTFSGNSAYAGGGVYCDKSTPIVANSILWDNSGRYGKLEPSQIYAVEADIVHSCIQGLTKKTAGKENIDLAPGFVNAAENDFNLKASSPCIDAGANEILPAEIDTDADGTARLKDGDNDGTVTIDIGAQEF